MIWVEDAPRRRTMGRGRHFGVERRESFASDPKRDPCLAAAHARGVSG
jgi:hypothetical protein